MRLNRQLYPVLWCAATGLFLAGIGLPMFTLQSLWVFKDSVSIVSAVGKLAQSGQWGLAILIGGFSIVLPMAKLIALSPWPVGPVARFSHWLHALGRWSMLDVFVVAVLVVVVKLKALTKVQIEWGLYAFAASVLLTLVISHFHTAEQPAAATP